MHRQRAWQLEKDEKAPWNVYISDGWFAVKTPWWAIEVAVDARRYEFLRGTWSGVRVFRAPKGGWENRVPGEVLCVVYERVFYDPPDKLSRPDSC